MYKSFFLLLISFFSSLLSAQNYSIKNYSVESGLPTQNVFCSAQDKSGKMWFATRVGVSVYDGLHWVNYDNRSGLPKISYFKIRIDTSGTAWAVPRYLANAICYFKDNRWHKIPPVHLPGSDALMLNSFEIIYSQGKTVLCAGTAEGLYFYRDSAWNKLSTADGLPDNQIFSIAADIDKLFIATQKGLAIFNGASIDNSLKKIIPSSHKAIAAVTIQQNSTGKKIMWLLGQKWIGYISEGKFNLLTTDLDLHRISCNDNILFSACGSGRLYFGNSYAKFFINTKTKKIFPLLQRNGFASNTAISVFVDREENVWFTDTRGIDKMNNFLFKNYTEPSGLQSNEVTAIIESAPGNFVIGHNNGITIMEKENCRRINFAEIQNNIYILQRILDFTKDKEGNIFFAASELGIGRLDKAGNISWIAPPNKEKMSSVLCDRNNTVWATSDHNLYKLSGSSLISVLPGKIPFPGFRKIFSFNDGSLYITSINGIYTFNNGVLKHLLKNTPEYHLMARNIFAILKTGKEEFLLGTEDGLYSLKNDKLTKVAKDNFPNNIPVFALNSDAHKNIFVGTNDGFYKFENTGKVNYYTMTNGLAGREVNRSAFMFDSFNNLWIGTDRGLSCFALENEKIKIPEPVIELQSLELIDGRRIPLNKNITLKNNENTFFFNLCGISFIDESAIEYKLALEGFDREWLHISQSQIENIRYTNLPYGVYRLQIRAKNRLGNWSRPVYSGLITIEQPIYNKWWFIILSVLVELLIFWGVWKLIVLRVKNSDLSVLVAQKTAVIQDSENKLRLANEELEKRVAERTAELAEANEKLKIYADEQKELNSYKDKFFSIVAHDLKGPFQGLLGVNTILEEEFDNLSDSQIKHFLRILRGSTQNVYNLIANLLQWSRLQTGKVPFEPEVLDLYDHAVFVQSLLHPNYSGKNIKFHIDVPEKMSLVADRNMLHSLLQNIGTNAIKFTPEGGSITIKAVPNDKYAKISIIDTGVGIPRENLEKLFRIDLQYSTRGTNEEEGTGLGLSICKEMVEKHNGEIWVESEEGKGSCFIFTIPLANNN